MPRENVMVEKPKPPDQSPPTDLECRIQLLPHRAYNPTVVHNLRDRQPRGGVGQPSTIRQPRGTLMSPTDLECRIQHLPHRAYNPTVVHNLRDRQRSLRGLVCAGYPRSAQQQSAHAAAPQLQNAAGKLFLSAESQQNSGKLSYLCIVNIILL